MLIWHGRVIGTRSVNVTSMTSMLWQYYAIKFFCAVTINFLNVISGNILAACNYIRKKRGLIGWPRYLLSTQMLNSMNLTLSLFSSVHISTSNFVPYRTNQISNYKTVLRFSTVKLLLSWTWPISNLSVSITPTYFCKVHFNIILPFSSICSHSHIPRNFLSNNL
jgi:hypothetical protein